MSTVVVSQDDRYGLYRLESDRVVETHPDVVEAPAANCGRTSLNMPENALNRH